MPEEQKQGHQYRRLTVVLNINESWHHLNSPDLRWDISPEGFLLVFNGEKLVAQFKNWDGVYLSDG